MSEEKRHLNPIDITPRAGESPDKKQVMLGFQFYQAPPDCGSCSFLLVSGLLVVMAEDGQTIEVTGQPSMAALPMEGQHLQAWVDAVRNYAETLGVTVI